MSANSKNIAKRNGTKSVRAQTHHSTNGDRGLALHAEETYSDFIQADELEKLNKLVPGLAGEYFGQWRKHSDQGLDHNERGLVLAETQQKQFFRYMFLQQAAAFLLSGGGLFVAYTCAKHSQDWAAASSALASIGIGGWSLLRGKRPASSP